MEFLFNTPPPVVAAIIAATAALFGALVNLWTATRLKRYADSYATQFSGTYKIRQEVAAHFLTTFRQARSESEAIYNADRAYGKVGDTSKAIACLQTHKKKLNDHLSVAQIYFDQETCLAMKMAVVELGGACNLLGLLSLNKDLPPTAEKVGRIMGYQDELNAFFDDAFTSTELTLIDRLKVVLVPEERKRWNFAKLKDWFLNRLPKGWTKP